MTKEMSNRQLRREKMRRQEARSRWIGIGLVTLGALFIAFLLIVPTLREALTPPEAVKTPAPVDRPKADGTNIGDPNAKAKIEVYEDFQCPACRQFTQDIEPLVLKQLVETGKAYYMFRHYPFIDTNTTTQESHRAANASMCANDQGKFWEYHDVLFANWNGENKNTFNRSRLLDFGTFLNLDMKTFTACVNGETHADEVQASFNEGNSRGVQGTPSIFINGQILKPGYIPSFDDIAAAVNAVQ